MRDLLILGAGVLAQEMVETVERVTQAVGDWNLIGSLSPHAG